MTLKLSFLENPDPDDVQLLTNEIAWISERRSYGETVLKQSIMIRINHNELFFVLIVQHMNAASP
ncbi:hypothetical protein Lnau_2357 [Legionella nautarum]|uniref:Uncharacterized protein n=1 Tax=Legionella nautarum TaxID=45070 RepID=A0A0W0WND9_9GAMM|nr:hypothetical protein [Legionella nautarum]KTD33606.1 hypothetical protein Lnau_2357 [Legionella nautarum]